MAMDPMKDGGNWYQYVYSNPIAYMDPDGLFAIVIGGEVTGSLGARGGGGGQIVILFGDQFDIGFVGYVTGGVATPSSGGSVVVGIVPEAQKISDLGGTSFGHGASGNILFGSLGLDISGGETSDGREILTYTVAMGGKASMPIEWHHTVTSSRAVSGRELIGNMMQQAQNIMQQAQEAWDNYIKSFADYYIKYNSCN